MADYIDREKLIRDLIDKGFYPALVKRAIENAPTEDVVPRSEVEQLQRNLEQCENGYNQQIHLLQCKHKDEVERLTVELEAMRGAANSYKMHYEKGKQQVAERYMLKADGSLEMIPTVESVRAEVAREIFEEIENIIIDGCEVYHTMEPEDFAELKKKYIGE